MSRTSVGARANPESAAPGVFSAIHRRLQTGVFDPMGRIVMLDAIVGALLIVRAGIPGLNLPLPIADGSMLVLVLIAMFRRPRFNSTPTLLFGLTSLALVSYLVLLTFLEEGDFVRRSVRIVALVGFALFLADDRINVRSVAFGVGFALLINIPISYTGLIPSSYGEFLTGFTGDKNVAGLYYAVFTLVLAGLATHAWLRWPILVVGGAALLLTGSRTSSAAFAIGLVWFVAGRWPLLARTAAAIGLYFAFDFADNYLSRLGVFGDRSGSDLLRERIDEATLAKVEATPWYGNGLGTATVQIDNNTWFSHNSYWSLIIEGGWPFLIAMLAIYAIFVLLPRPASGVRTGPRIAIEAAAIAMLLCSFRLGEVFVTIPSFFMLGAALFLLAEDRERVAADRSD